MRNYFSLLLDRWREWSDAKAPQQSSGCLSSLQGRTLLALLTIALLMPLSAFAQLAGAGAISGTVTDQSGAVIPNATVTADADNTNTLVVRTTTSAGDYNITPLLPDTYTVTVSAPGFEQYIQKNVTVNALSNISLNIKLTVGSVDQAVTITDAPPVLETTNATLGAVMDNEMYSQLPLLMGAGNNADQRRATDFSSLMPGVQNTYAASSSNNSTDATGGVNGGNPNGGTSDIYIDGIDLPEGDGIGDPRFTWSAISVDAINQFQVQTTGIPAQYAGQGMQNYSVKSGGNAFHGSVYEYLRNTILDSWATNNKIPTLTGAPVPAGGSCTSTALSASTSWCALGGIKPKEIQNEFGIVLSGPAIKNKVFLFYNYGQYRFQHGPAPQVQTAPTLGMMGYTASGGALGYADFSGYATTVLGSNGPAIFDPATTKIQNCTSVATNPATACTRTAFANNQIPAARFSQAAQFVNKYMLPYEALVNQNAYTNNLVTGYNYGLSNWYQTGRIDYNISSNQQLGIIIAFGRQASTGPNSSGAANALGPPFNTSQAYHPVTTVDIVKHTWTITPHIVNQFALAFGRYQSISVTPDDQPQYAASNSGLLNTPAGQASFFPSLTYANPSTAYNINTEAGYDENNKVNNTYNLTDDVQWQYKQHTFTFGGQIVEVQFDYTKNLTNSSPMTYGFSSVQTEGYSAGVAQTTTGQAFASYMLGAVNSSSVSVGVPVLGTRWLDPSFWAQDDWKLSSKLTLNVGLRWDLFPAIHESHDLITWLNPTGQNSNSGNLGTLAFAGGNSSDGYHTGVHIPSSLWLKNVAPRIGLAYSIDPKTVIRASYGLNFARGDWTSGSQSGSPSTTGLTPAASATSVGAQQPQFYWDGTACGGGSVAGDGFTPCGWTGSVAPPQSTLPTGASLAEFGATETATLKGANAASPVYWDPYLGARTPEYINWSFGVMRQLTKDMSVSISYVGSQGHFISVANAMYQRNDKLPESYAALAGYQINGSTQTPCSGAGCTSTLLTQLASPTYIGLVQQDGFTPPNPFASAANYYGAKQGVSSYFTNFPQYSGVSDTTSFVGNENWNALEVSFKQRMSHGLDWMANYTWSKGIDDLGTFRVYDNQRLDRSLTAADQPQALVATVVYRLPVGKGHMFGDNFFYRAIASDWTVSDIVQLHSGLPILVTASGCASQNILNTCMPSVVPNQKGRQYKYGKTSTGQTASWDSNSPNFIGHVNYVNPAAFNVALSTITGTAAANPQANVVAFGPSYYAPGNAARTAPLGMFGPALFEDDLALKRSFPIYHEWKLSFEADVANLTNHVWYAPPTAAVASGATTSFGAIAKVAPSYLPRDVQLAARINW